MGMNLECVHLLQRMRDLLPRRFTVVDLGDQDLTVEEKHLQAHFGTDKPLESVGDLYRFLDSAAQVD